MNTINKSKFSINIREVLYQQNKHHLRDNTLIYGSKKKELSFFEKDNFLGAMICKCPTNNLHIITSLDNVSQEIEKNKNISISFFYTCPKCNMEQCIGTLT